MTVDPIHFKVLAQKDPGEVARRTGAAWESKVREYRIRVWGRAYGVAPAIGRIRALGPESPVLHEYVDLLILHYLLGCQSIPLAHEWVSEKDIPGGSAFFRGPHTLPTREIARVFGEDGEGFSSVCTRLGGRSLAMADQAFAFDITPRIPVAVLLWRGDGDFDADAGLLFDKTICRHLPLDIIYALGVMVCRTLIHPGMGL